MFQCFAEITPTAKFDFRKNRKLIKSWTDTVDTITLLSRCIITKASKDIKM